MESIANLGVFAIEKLVGDYESFWSSVSTEEGQYANFIEPGTTAIVSQEKVNDEMKSYCR